MASITYWNRLEPRPRSNSLTRALSAAIRDPLWMLTRQWQFGEYEGEDAASPAYVTTHAETANITSCGPTGAQQHSYDPLSSPLEPLTEREPMEPTLSLRVELGMLFQRLLEAAGLGATLLLYRATYRIARPSEAALAALADPAEARFLRVVAERSLDGLALYEDIVDAAPLQPAVPSAPPTVLPVLEAFRQQVDDTYGPIGRGDPEAWRPSQLEYAISVVANEPGVGGVELLAQPGGTGNVDWYSFDELRPATSDVPLGEVTSTSFSILPIQVRFKGMPHKRFWHFERGGANFGDIAVDRRDVAKLIVIDFMLVHGNDWYVIPFEMQTGSLCRIVRLEVTDVFGDKFEVRRADEGQKAGLERWSMYATTKAQSNELADFLLLPPSSGEVDAEGPSVERVIFGRDEMANMVWAIEHTTESGLGEPLRGDERPSARQPAAPPHVATPPNAAPLLYRIQSSVPEYWIPFLPVALDASRREIALERGAMLRYTITPPEPILPVGRILNPAATPYIVREEEVPREGVIVERTAHRARWVDGSSHFWFSRKVTVGLGESQSGLRFDVAVVRPPPPPSNA